MRGADGRWAVSRRRLLAGALVGGVGLAGCLQETPRRTSRAILVTNQTDTAFTVTLRVYALPGATVETDTEATPTSTADSTETGPGTPTSTVREPPTSQLEQVLVRREDTPPGEGFGVGADALPGGDLRVRVTTTAGQSNRYDWSRFDARSTLDVRVEPNAIRFTEID